MGRCRVLGLAVFLYSCLLPTHSLSQGIITTVAGSTQAFNRLLKTPLDRSLTVAARMDSQTTHVTATLKRL